MQKILTLSLCGFILLAMSSTAMADSFDEALSAYQVGEYRQAMETWMIEAEKGNADAQYTLGFMYTFDQGG